MTEKMKKQPQTRAYQKSELNIGQAAKPVEKALNRLTKELTKEKKKSPEIRTSPFRYN